MTRFPEAAQPVRGGFVLWDVAERRWLKSIPFQFNPDTLTRTLQQQGSGDESGDRLEVLRLKGPPHESYKFDAEFDAADYPDRARDGLLPVLSALEITMYPRRADLLAERRLAEQGAIEVAPLEAPLLVLVLGKKRVLPVRITEFSVTEDAFDTALNPIRAKVSIGVRVLTVDDVGYVHKAGELYLSHHRDKEAFADRVRNPIADVGLTTL